MADYVIRGGRGGYDRLLLLAQDRWPDTAALLQRAGVRPGMRAVDVGCGGGTVTLELADRVAPATVVGLDMDEIKLGLAAGEAARRGIANAEFRTADVTAWDEPDSYDLVCTRFVLQHLRDPAGLLRRMWAAVRPGGVLVVEDADFEGSCCYPPCEAHDFFLRTYARVLERRGGDHELGRKLPAYALEAGVTEPEITLAQSVCLRGDTKMLAWSTLDATADAIVAEGVASREEVGTALDALASYSREPRTIICGPRIFQLWATK